MFESTPEGVAWMKRILRDIEDVQAQLRAEQAAWERAIAIGAKHLGLGDTIDLFRAREMSRDEIVEALYPACKSAGAGTLLEDALLRIRQFFALCGREQWAAVDRLVALSRLLGDPQLQPGEFSPVEEASRNCQ